MSTEPSRFSTLLKRFLLKTPSQGNLNHYFCLLQNIRPLGCLALKLKLETSHLKQTPYLFKGKGGEGGNASFIFDR